MYCVGFKDKTGDWDRSRVGRIFPVENLCLPLVALVSIVVAAVVSSIPFHALWHA